MKIYKKISDWITERDKILSSTATIGFVPTMGALHEGHLSLIQTSMNENDFTIASIFINPTQFSNPDDLKNYPRLIEQDIEALRKLELGYLLVPEYNEIYNDNFNYRVTEQTLSPLLCGAFRPEHFTGVLTIVLKLLNIAKAKRAYFGEKDYQQYLLIKGMVESFFIPTEIIACPTVREHDGLAMSSRNLNLNPYYRKLAPEFPKSLISGKPIPEIKADLEKKGFKVDYIIDFKDRRFGAVHLGPVRLIDNVII